MHRAGFSLVEVMIASAVCAVALAGTISAMGHLAQVDDVTHDRDLAMAEIVRQVERCQQYRVSDLHDQIDNDPGYWFDVRSLDPPEGRQQCGRIEVPATSTRDDATLPLTVTVVWLSKLGQNQMSQTYTHVDR